MGHLLHASSLVPRLYLCDHTQINHILLHLAGKSLRAVKAYLNTSGAGGARHAWET